MKAISEKQEQLHVDDQQAFHVAKTSSSMKDSWQIVEMDIVKDMRHVMEMICHKDIKTKDIRVLLAVR